MASSVDMDVIMEDSTTPTTPTEFLCFPRLPAELQQMVWHESLPTLDLQRFNAEIARKPDRPAAQTSRELTLCLTPNDHFIQQTRGLVGLLGACYDSRAVAMGNIKARLPIQYIKQNQDGSISIRSARVPYNPDGQLCISGLGPALHFAAVEGLGARGTSVALTGQNRADLIANTIKCVTLPEIKNLAIALDPPRQFRGQLCIMFGWDFQSFTNLARRMAKHKLETVELIDDGWLDERHDNENHTLSFEWQHTPTSISRSITDPGVRPRGHIPWSQLLDNFKANTDSYKAIKKLRDSAGGQ